MAGLVLAPVVLIAAAFGALAAASTPPTGALSPTSASDIPPAMLALYQTAADRFGISAALLAGVGKVECDHDRDPTCVVPNSAGAVGPMQFLPATFAQYAWAAGVPDPSVLDPHDAVFAAAAMLAANGASTDPTRALYAYNHSRLYVAQVLAWAQSYTEGDPRAAEVVAVAESYIGVPYRWGGNDYSGIDCSGLVKNAYGAVGITLPRVAADQAQVGIGVDALGDAAPGDLLAYGPNPASVDHIALYVGDGQMIEAAHAGTSVRQVPARSAGLITIRRVL